MITVHARQHEFGPKEPRIRLWTNYEVGDMFVIVPLHDAEILCALLNKLNIGYIKLHNIDCDATQPCGCEVICGSDDIIKKHLK